jgi:hypothetical protein
MHNFKSELLIIWSLIFGLKYTQVIYLNGSHAKHGMWCTLCRRNGARLTLWLTDQPPSMEQSPSWEANSHPASQEVLCLVSSLKVHYCAHKNPPLFPILSQINPVHTFIPCFPKLQYDTTSSSVPKLSVWSLPFRFSNQNFVCISHLPHACCMPCPSNPPWLYRPNDSLWSIEIMKLLIMQSSPSSLLGPNILNI